MAAELSNWRKFSVKEKDAWFFSLVTIIGTFAFFSLAGTKLPNYIIGIFPFLSILIAWVLQLKRHYRLNLVLTAVSGLFTAALIAGVFFVKLDPIYAENKIYLAGFFGFFLAAIVTMGITLKFKAEWAVRAYAVAMVFVTMYIAYPFFGQVEKYKDVKKITHLLKAEKNLQNVALWREFSPYLMFEINQNVAMLSETEEDLQNYVAKTKGTMYVIMPVTQTDKMKELFPTSKIRFTGYQKIVVQLDGQ